MKSLRRFLLASLLLAPHIVQGAKPLADVHVHYKWSQEEVTSAQDALQILRDRNIALAVVIGTPPELALELQALDPDRIIPVWSPYRAPGEWSTWTRDLSVPDRARAALESGRYHGIGELHLIGGFAPDWNTPVISGLIQLGLQHDVPLLLHTEFSRNKYLLGLCRNHPRLRIIWAHAGAILPVGQVAEVLDACPRVWVDLAARDPWRYVDHPITDTSNRLLPEWRRLIENYPGRFLVGSDPVWPVEQLDSWDEPDSGWEHYGRFIDFHRHWLGELPAGVAGKVRLTNALTVFGRQPGSRQH